MADEQNETQSFVLILCILVIIIGLGFLWSYASAL